MPETVEGTEARADAAVIDAEADAAARAEAAANATVTNAAIVAAAAEDAAAQRVEQIAGHTNDALAAQEGSIEWLRTRNEEQASLLTLTVQRLEKAETCLGEMASRMETGLSQIMERLTPPVSENPPVTQTTDPAQAEPDASADGQKAPVQEAPRRKYRVL